MLWRSADLGSWLYIPLGVGSEFLEVSFDLGCFETLDAGCWLLLTPVCV